MLPCIIATCGLVAPTMHAAIEWSVKQPGTLLTIKREFSNSDLIVARAAVFGLLGASELHTRKGTGDAMVELAAALSADVKALSHHARARQALVEVTAALLAMNIAAALVLQERIKQLR